MYQHADQTWRKQPAFFSDANIDLLAMRLKEYCLSQRLARCLLVFHGGEPLLAGADRLLKVVGSLRSALDGICLIDFGVQTNGTLLTAEILDLFQSVNLSVSVSVDGPKVVNDVYRLDHQGRSHFDKIENGLRLLQGYPSLYMGCISVINPSVNPRVLFEFFKHHNVPEMSFLLPDANYNTPPKGRDVSPDVYQNWLINAFDIWYSEYAEIPCKTFEMIIRGLFGQTGLTDGLGLGVVNMLTIETDGSYHDLDVLKITDEGVDSLGDSLASSSFESLHTHPKLLQHQNLLTKNGLCETCKQCEVVDICGGGSVPHRYGDGHFNRPTIYCSEMKSLIKHIKSIVMRDIEKDIAAQKQFESESSLGSDFLRQSYIEPETAGPFLDDLSQRLGRIVFDEFHAIIGRYITDGSLSSQDIHIDTELSDYSFFIRPNIFFWVKAHFKLSKGLRVKSLDGDLVATDLDYLTHILNEFKEFLLSPNLAKINLHREDAWLRLPFSRSIVFEDQNAVVALKDLTLAALDIVKMYNPFLYQEMGRISPEIQFIRDITASPEKAVSFSDDAIPGCLYVCAWQNNKLIDPYDLADSLIHEHLHQKLYLLQRLHPIVRSESPELYSPWRQCLRPVSGVFHAVFVFSELIHYWQFVCSNGPSHLSEMASREVSVNRDRVIAAMTDLDGADLTQTGHYLLQVMREKMIKFGKSWVEGVLSNDTSNS